MKRRVAITGIGLVTPLGNNTSSTWSELMKGKSGVARIRSFDATGFPTQIAAEVKNFHPEELLQDKKPLRFTSRYGAFALVAAEEALHDAQVIPTEHTAENWGLALGSGMMSIDFESWLSFQRKFAKTGALDLSLLGHEGLRYFSPSQFSQEQTNSVLGILARKHHILGYTINVHTACSSGAQALGLGLRAIQRNEVDYMLTGGFDSMIHPFGLAGFSLLKALSTDNERPSEASRPFDATRNGFVLGEGAAFLVLEAWEKARARKANIYAELAGEGNSLSSFRITDPHPSGEGPLQAMRSAIKNAGITPDQVDYINAHGTSTQMNDFSETNAIKATFGDYAYQVPVSSTKSLMGHLIASAGAVEGAIIALAIRHAVMPFTANLKNPDPACDLDYIPEGPRKKEIRYAISNSFGFGGTNNCLVFKNSML